MKESLDEALEELKRVDHLLFVSLKYTRTVDVLMNTLSRMIDSYDRLIETLLRLALEEKKIPAIPKTPRERADLVKQVYDDQKIRDNVDLYSLMRKIHKSNPERENEYRRHVTARTFVDGREEIVNIDICSEYFYYLKEFYEHVKTMTVEFEEKHNKGK
ncbi:hypothetical protein ACFL1B_01185 [Nanoarchaeota archaeon]